jgi:hypothetical protein
MTNAVREATYNALVVETLRSTAQRLRTLSFELCKAGDYATAEKIDVIAIQADNLRWEHNT